MTDDRGQRTEDRGQMTEDRKRMTEDRKRMRDVGGSVFVLLKWDFAVEGR
jgi:hypothetical protein